MRAQSEGNGEGDAEEVTEQEAMSCVTPLSIHGVFTADDIARYFLFVNCAMHDHPHCNNVAPVWPPAGNHHSCFQKRNVWQTKYAFGQDRPTAEFPH
jgi:hypothetical protein